MDSFDFYRHSEDLKVIDAIILLIDLDPGDVTWVGNYTLSRDPGNGYRDNFKPPEFKAAFSIVTTAIMAGKLPAIKRYKAFEAGQFGFLEDLQEDEDRAQQYEIDYNNLPDDIDLTLLSGGRRFHFKVEPDWSQSTVSKVSFCLWLSERGIKSKFFLPDSQENAVDLNGPGYLDPGHKCYSSKLAAAIHAWEAVSKSDWENSPKTVIKLLEEWLENNYQDYEWLIYRGNKNSTGVKETAKTVNWRPNEGA
ncbi:hypothetical protein [Desulfogranum marinum]|uniref:hypothetical protein n=1 Tax=Desulfogranum marinum TaxID=453220 RepID=UPI001963C3A4|nr:hypothetical protein [Desulfogranum marinum]MBM9514371.1 hypothetical protein [Desulfogranum marinum]